MRRKQNPSTALEAAEKNPRQYLRELDNKHNHRHFQCGACGWIGETEGGFDAHVKHWHTRDDSV